MQRLRNKWTVILFSMTVAVFILACGGGGDGSTDGESPRTSSYLGTQNPGDVWSWTIEMDGSTGSFSATNETLDHEYAGDVDTLPNDFLRLTVTSTTEPGMTIPATAYAIEVPDTALIVKPEGDDPVVVCAAQGACPTLDATYNWVPLVNSSFDLTSDTAYGVTDATISGAEYTFDSQFYLLDGSSNGTDTATGFTCSGGRLTHTGDPMTIGVTPSGMLIGDEGPGAGGFVGMQAPADPIDLDDLLAHGREYRGVMIKARTAGDESEAVWARADGLGGFVGGHYDDFEAGIEDSDATEITFDAQPSPGVFIATQTETSGSSSLVIMASRINGRYFIYGSGAGATHTVAENFLAIEK
jgi:hypothetical protein